MSWGRSTSGDRTHVQQDARGWEDSVRAQDTKNGASSAVIAGHALQARIAARAVCALTDDLPQRDVIVSASGHMDADGAHGSVSVSYTVLAAHE